jgi:hypothetical protein
MADPAFMIDYNTDKVTQNTIQSSTLSFEVAEVVIGAGGFGGWSGFHDDSKAGDERAGGGGGGGAGMHPVYSYAPINNVYTDTLLPAVVPGSGLPLGGQGGKSGSYHPNITTPGGSPAANGGTGYWLGAGAGGAGAGAAPSAFDAGSFVGHAGGYGGSAFYFRSNVAAGESGTTIKISTVHSGAYIQGGGGGGAGIRNGAGGAGGTYSASGADTSAGGVTTKGGLAGAALFWNTANVEHSRVMTNGGGTFSGRDGVIS